MLPSQNALVQSPALEASVGPLCVDEQDTTLLLGTVLIKIGLW